MIHNTYQTIVQGATTPRTTQLIVVQFLLYYPCCVNKNVLVTPFDSPLS